MGRWTKRLLVLALIGAGASAFSRIRRANRAPSARVAPASTWPAFAPDPAPATQPAAPADEPASQPPEEPTAQPAEAIVATGVDWVMPADDGSCPTGFPIKANNNSRIYHLPGGRFYDRTKAERCYAEALAAERDGYRRAKA